MENESRGSIYGKCLCCLAEGKHQHGGVYTDRLRICLNLTLATDSRMPSTICTNCIDFLNEVQKFREMVVASQKNLHNMTLDGLAKSSNQGYFTIVEEDKIKLEGDEEHPSLHSEDTYAANVTDVKDEIASYKSESDSKPDNSDCDVSEDSKTDINSENIEIISKDEYVSKVGDKGCRKKRKNEDTVTFASILDSIQDKPSLAYVKSKASLLRRERRLENSNDPMQIDNKKICSNILLILKHSNITPFRRYFSIFKCLYCPNEYAPFKELKEHVESEHANVCETVTSAVLRSALEININADISNLKCVLCDQNLETIECLTEHLSKTHDLTIHETVKKPSHGVIGFHMNTDTPKCHICQKEFFYFKMLKVHMNEHYGFYVCHVCGKKFITNKGYEAHMLKYKKESVECKYCKKILNTRPALQYHIEKEHRKKTKIKCLKCPATFPCGQYMKRVHHMAEVHGVKRPVFKCDACSKEFKTVVSLNSHKRYIHKRLREFKCEICGYITTDGSYMRKHMDMHRGVKRFECEVCKKKLATSTSLKMHTMMHENDKRFACSLCDAAFIQKHCLKRHMKSKHPDANND